MYSPADLREVEVWLQQFRADGRRDPKHAAATLAAHLRATRTAPDLWERVTRTLLAEKELDGAEVLLRSGLDAYPQRHALRTLLGNTLRLQARYAESERELRGVLADDPRDELASRSLTFLLREQGRMNAAAEALVRFGPDPSQTADAACTAATFLAQCGHSIDALRVCESALARHPEAAQLRLLTGTLASTLGQFERAAAELRHALRLDPNRAGAWLWLALTHHFATRDDPDLRAMEAAATRAPAGSDLAVSLGFALGKAYDDLDDVPAAGRVLRVANAAVAARTPWQAVAWDALVARRMAAPRFESVAPPAFTPILIVGLPRTGTTLIATQLARHPDIRNRGETGWLGELASQGEANGFSRAFLRSAAALYARQLRQDDTPARFYIDKNPANFLHLDLAAALFPNARVIHCRRNRRDAALSMWRQHMAGDGAKFIYRFADISQVADGDERLMRHWRERLSLPIYDLDYEALVTRPEAIVAELLRFVGTKTGSEAPSLQAPAAIGTASLWQVRQSVNTRSIGRWKAYAPHVPELLEIAEV